MTNPADAPAAQQGRPANDRARQLDSLRAFAVAAVIISHTITENYKIGEFQFFEIGGFAVHLFFVLSGFLITGQLLAENELRRERGDGLRPLLGSFYARRVLRLLPAYYLALCGAWLIDLSTIRAEFPWHALQLTNVYFGMDQVAEYSSPVGHLWSLSMEWQFYLVWPLIVLVCRPRVLVAVTVSLFAFSFVARFDTLPLPEALYRSSIPASLDSLAMGALLAIAVARSWPVERIAGWLWWSLLAYVVMTVPLLLGYADLGWELEPYAHEVMNLFFMLLVYRAYVGMDGPVGRVLDNPGLQYTGLISYGIYLYHQYILSAYSGASLRLFGYLPLDYGWKLSIALFVVTWIVSHYSWIWFEQFPPPVPLSAKAPGSGSDGCQWRSCTLKAARPSSLHA